MFEFVNSKQSRLEFKGALDSFIVSNFDEAMRPIRPLNQKQLSVFFDSTRLKNKSITAILLFYGAVRGAHPN